MKKLICTALAAIMLAATLFGCAAGTPASSRIRLTSSDAADAAKWLGERLGDSLDENVVLGTDASDLGVDLTALEDDGYMIRNLNGEVALLARTSDGLDRAVRKYAKTVESGEAVTEITFHEGPRVKRLEIAGRGIAEYTIYTDDDPMAIDAANEFSSLIAKACGVALPVVTAEKTAPYISVSFTHDESLGNVGYTWEITEEGLTLCLSDIYKTASRSVGVQRYLEHALDWFGLSYGYEDLPSTELVSLEAGDSGREVCPYDYFYFYGDNFFYAAPGPSDPLDHDVPGYSQIVSSCHGILSMKLAGALSKSPDKPWLFDQPCWLDDEFYDYALEDLIIYIENQISAGKVPGETLRFIDISQADNGGWCNCKKCLEMLKKEGTQCAAVLTWANKVSEELNETYPGIYYGVFAYAGTNQPPVTIRPNDLIYITYCFDTNCSLHTLDGSKCTTGIPKDEFDRKKGRDNVTLAGYYDEWCDITPQIYAWYYSIGNSFLTSSIIHTVRDNMKYLTDRHTKGLFWEAEDEGYSTMKVARLLYYALAWDPYMSDEKYEEVYSRILRVLYGDAAEYMREYIEIETRITENSACATCWGWGEIHEAVNPALWEKYFDTLFALSEKALALADTRRQEIRLTRLSCSCIYKGTMSSYYNAYDAYDDERVAELCRRYSLIDTRLNGIGTDMRTIVALMVGDHGMYERDLETQAWKSEWYRFATYIGQKIPSRQRPEQFRTTANP